MSVHKIFGLATEMIFIKIFDIATEMIFIEIFGLVPK